MTNGTTRFEFIGLFTALTLGGLAVFWRLHAASPYIDELFMVYVGSMRIPDIFHETAIHDFNPPFVYVIAHFLIEWTRSSLLELRYFTAAFDFVTILATWAITRRLFGATAAVIAAVLIALEPGLVVWARFFRHYAIVWALVTCSWWVILIAREARGRARTWWWIAYAALAVITINLQYLTAFVLVSQALYALTSLRSMWPIFAGAAAAVASLIPWHAALATQYSGWDIYGGPPGQPFWWVPVLAANVGQFLPSSGHLFFESALILLVVATSVAAAWLYRRTMLPFWLLAPVLAVVVMMVTGKNTASADRYWYMAAPAVAASVGAVSVRLFSGRWRVAAALVPAALLLANVVGIYNYLFDPYYQPADWYAAGNIVAAFARPADVSIIDQPGFLPLAFKLPGLRRTTMFVSMAPYGRRAARWAAAHPRSRVWYMMEFPLYRNQLEPALRQHRVLLARWTQRRSHPSWTLWIELFGPSAVRAPTFRRERWRR